MGRLAPKVSDDCLSCSDHWDNHNPPKPRMKLIKVTDTQNKHLVVLLCPYCDGERAISLAKPSK